MAKTFGTITRRRRPIFSRKRQVPWWQAAAGALIGASVGTSLVIAALLLGLGADEAFSTATDDGSAAAVQAPSPGGDIPEPDLPTPQR